MLLELGVGLTLIAISGYMLYRLRNRKSWLRRHVLRHDKIKKYLEGLEEEE